MADAKQTVQKGFDIVDFASRHWGEIYTGIDVLQNVFKGMGGGGDVPENLDPKLKGIVGLLGLKDERDFLLKLNALQKVLTPKQFQRLMQYFAWEITQAKRLSDKLTGPGAYVVRVLYANRLRTLFAGIPDSPGEDLGTFRTTVREFFGDTPASDTSSTSGDGKKKAKKRPFRVETAFDRKIKGDGSQPGVDILAMLSGEIERNWRSLSKKYKDEPTNSEGRLAEAFELTRDSFQITGLPRMPRPEEVPNMRKLYSWIMEYGGPIATQIVSAAQTAGIRVWTEISTAPQQIEEAHTRLRERNRQKNAFMRGLHWLLS